MPFIAPVVNYRGKQLLDGGISDPIPVRKAQEDGFKKSVVILTRNHGYAKKNQDLGGLLRKLIKISEPCEHDAKSL